MSASSLPRVSVRNRSVDGTAHQGSLPEPLSENSIGCLALSQPARIGGRSGQFLPNAYVSCQKQEHERRSRSWKRGSHIAQSLGEANQTLQSGSLFASSHRELDNSDIIGGQWWVTVKMPAARSERSGSRRVTRCSPGSACLTVTDPGLSPTAWIGRMVSGSGGRGSF